MNKGVEADQTSVFISYARRDQNWLKRLRLHMTPLFAESKLSFWDDTQLEAGMHWREVIESQLDAPRVGVLLISANFLASRFILGTELPALRKLESEKKCELIPVIIKPSVLGQVSSRSELAETNDLLKWLSELQYARSGRKAASKPLLGMPEAEQEAALAQVACDIFAKANSAKMIAESLGPKGDPSILKNLLTEWERDHLLKLKDRAPFPYSWRKSFEQELGRLLLLRFIDRKEGRGFRTAMRDQRPSNDLHDHFQITNLGEEYLNGYSLRSTSTSSVEALP